MDKSLNRKISLDVLAAWIMSVLLYASQTWSLTNKHKYTIEVCQRKMVRKILGVSTRQNLQHPTPRMVHAEDRRTTSFTIQMEIGRTCRKASPPQMGPGKNYVGSLQRQAKHQMGRLFQKTSGTTLVKRGERKKWV
jgi:hypothetical protein